MRAARRRAADSSGGRERRGWRRARVARRSFARAGGLRRQPTGSRISARAGEPRCLGAASITISRRRSAGAYERLRDFAIELTPATGRADRGLPRNCARCLEAMRRANFARMRASGVAQLFSRAQRNARGRAAARRVARWREAAHDGARQSAGAAVRPDSRAALEILRRSARPGAQADAAAQDRRSTRAEFSIPDASSEDSDLSRWPRPRTSSCQPRRDIDEIAPAERVESIAAARARCATSSITNCCSIASIAGFAWRRVRPMWSRAPRWIRRAGVSI